MISKRYMHVYAANFVLVSRQVCRIEIESSLKADMVWEHPILWLQPLIFSSHLLLLNHFVLDLLGSISILLHSVEDIFKEPGPIASDFFFNPSKILVSEENTYFVITPGEFLQLNFYSWKMYHLEYSNGNMINNGISLHSKV